LAYLNDQAVKYGDRGTELRIKLKQRIIFVMIKRKIVRVRMANVREEAMLQNIVILL
jgi:hypothetical protein